MNNIDKLIRHYVLEIVMVIVLVIASIPVWNMFDKSELASLAKKYDNMNYIYLDIDKYISDNYFEDVVAVKNDTNTERNYNLLIKISKDIDLTDAVVTVNDNKLNMSEIKYNENNDYKFYSISEDSIVAASKDYNISFENCELKYSDVEYEIIESETV